MTCTIVTLVVESDHPLEEKTVTPVLRYLVTRFNREMDEGGFQTKVVRFSLGPPLMQSAPTKGHP
jgi:hypothetical protein